MAGIPLPVFCLLFLCLSSPPEWSHDSKVTCSETTFQACLSFPFPPDAVSQLHLQVSRSPVRMSLSFSLKKKALSGNGVYRTLPWGGEQWIVSRNTSSDPRRYAFRFLEGLNAGIYIANPLALRVPGLVTYDVGSAK